MALPSSFVLMSDANVLFFTEDIDFAFLHKKAAKGWLSYVATSEGNSIKNANIIFCSDQYILSINKEYLAHNYFTDIITFPLMDAGAPIETDMFISIDTVRSNAEERAITFEKELLRVIVHGFLHMLGYGDKTEVQQKKMREREDFYLNYFYANYF